MRRGKGIVCAMLLLAGLTSCLSARQTDGPSVSIESEFLEILEHNQEGQEELESGNAHGTEADSQEVTQPHSTAQTEEASMEVPLWESDAPQDVFSELSQEEQMQWICQSIGAILVCLPQLDYYSPAVYEADSSFAASYLQKIASLYYREEARQYAGIENTSCEQYVAWSKEKTGFFLDVVFGGWFTEEQLECDEDSILFHDGCYYIGIPQEEEEVHVSVNYRSEGGEIADCLFDFLEEGTGREKRSGQLYVSLQMAQLTYSDQYFFEIIVQ